MAKRNQQFIDITIERISKMSNRELLDETMMLANGNDHDPGFWSELGAIEYNLLKTELELRLGDWLNK